MVVGDLVPVEAGRRAAPRPVGARRGLPRGPRSRWLRAVHRRPGSSRGGYPPAPRRPGAPSKSPEVLRPPRRPGARRGRRRAPRSRWTRCAPANWCPSKVGDALRSRSGDLVSVEVAHAPPLDDRRPPTILDAAFAVLCSCSGAGCVISRLICRPRLHWRQGRCALYRLGGRPRHAQLPRVSLPFGSVGPEHDRYPSAR